MEIRKLIHNLTSVKIAICACFLFTILTSSNARAADEILENTSFSLSTGYVSKYMWRGYDLFNDDPSFQPDISVDFESIGLYMGIWAAYSTNGGCVDPFGDPCKDWDEYDYYIGRYSSLWEDSTFETGYTLEYIYFNFFRQTGQDTQKVSFGVEFPGLLPSVGLESTVLYSTVYYGWVVKRGGVDSRWLKFGINHDYSFDKHTATVLAELYWDDGAGSFEMEKGWSSLKVGLTDEMKIGFFSFTPTVYY